VRTYDCNHKHPEHLERELLFREVMRLRQLLAQADTIIERVTKIEEIPEHIKTSANQYLTLEILKP